MKRITTMSIALLMAVIGNFLKAQDFISSLLDSSLSFYTSYSPVPFAFDAEGWIAENGYVKSDNSTNYIVVELDIVDETGVVGFDYSIHSWYSEYEFHFSVNGTDSLHIAGTNTNWEEWHTASFALPKGKHELKWNFSGNGYACVRSLKAVGAGVEAPYLSLSKSLVDQRITPTGSVKKDTIDIINLGNQDLQITSLSGLKAPFSVVSSPSGALKKFQKGQIVVAFSPDAEGFYAQDLVIENNGGKRVLPVRALCSDGYTVDISTAGTLNTLVENTGCDSLTIYGCMNDNDFYFIQNRLPNLKYLNLLGTVLTGNRIPNYASGGKSSLKEVLLPANLETVGTQAFDRCSSLEKVIFPETLKVIEQEGFSQCNLSGELVLPKGVESIGNYAFDYNPISKVIFPDSLQVIADRAFEYCNKLQEVVFNEKLVQIGQYAFRDCYRLNKATLKGSNPPAIRSESFNYTKVFYVPSGTGAVYAGASYWNDMAIIDGNSPVKVEVTLNEAGTLGEKILNQGLESVELVNELIVSGPLNSDDYYQIRNRMPKLISIDMTGATIESLPDNFFEGRFALLRVKLPATLKTIGSYAFRNCYGLTALELPDGLTSIGYYAFGECKPLRNIVLPSTLTSIAEYAFYQCNSLSSIEIPDGVGTIENYTFYQCSNLKSVKFPSGLTEIKSSAFQECGSLKTLRFPEKLWGIGNYGFYQCSSLESAEFPSSLTRLNHRAFYECKSLKEIVLPASLQYADRAFESCSNIGKVTSLASVPPALESNIDILYNVPKENCILYVPLWSVNDYKLKQGWDEFPVINPLDYETDEINVSGKLTIAEDIRPTNNPVVSVFSNGKLTVRGTEVFSMKKYTQNHRLEMYDWYNTTSDNDRSTYTGLISESKAMRADSVCYRLSARGQVWMYLSVPFDTKVSDISVGNDALYVIRKYDGATRAKGGGTNWKNMTNDSTLHAGEGYIFQFNKDVTDFSLEAVNNENKNRLFSGDALSRSLNEYTAEFAHNRSWNFIGNPYPCYFDICYMNYSSPLTVWNGRGYTAISPLDDDYVLRPMQAFFVQKPVDVDAVTFMPEGRQMDASIRQRAMNLRASNSEIANRILFDLTYGNNDYTDKTRLVINPEMTTGYDISRDAAKFMSDDSKLPQFYTLDRASMRYAINERLLAEGIIPLGIYVGKEDTYTIALEHCPTANESIVLVDKLLNREVPLDRQDYEFKANPGTYNDRFEIRVNIVPTGLEKENGVQPVRVKGGNEQIEVMAENGDEITVYTVSGQVHTRNIAAGAITVIPAEPGFYVVKVAGQSFKTLVTK